MGGGVVSQESVEQVKEKINKLVDKVESLEKVVREMYETLRSSEVKEVADSLGDYIKTLKFYVARMKSEFSISIKETHMDKVEVVVSRGKFTYTMEIPKQMSIVEIYEKFFNDTTALGVMVFDLTMAIIKSAEAVKRNIDVIERLGELEDAVEVIGKELDYLRSVKSDP